MGLNLRKHREKEAFIEEKNMLTIGSIFLPLKVATMRIVNIVFWVSDPVRLKPAYLATETVKILKLHVAS